MRASRHVRSGLVAALAFAAGLATFAATGFGQGERSRATVHAARATGQMAATSSSVSLTYLSTTGTVQPGAFSGARGTCPRTRPHPLSAWFDSGSDKVVLGAARPDPSSRPGSRSWLVGVTNLGDTSARYIVGLVCAK
jgi:hypothetical protein